MKTNHFLFILTLNSKVITSGIIKGVTAKSKTYR